MGPVEQLVQLRQDRLVDNLTVDAFGNGEEDLGDCGEPDQVGMVRVYAVQCESPYPGGGTSVAFGGR